MRGRHLSLAGVSLATALACASPAEARGDLTPFTEEAASRGIDYTPQSAIEGLGSAFADFDKDGDIDLSDLVMFHVCFTGDTPGSLESGCEMMEFDGDADVDHADFTLFLVDYSGPLDDCNGNGMLDFQEILDGAADVNGNGILDACEASCSNLNGDAVVDDADLLQLTNDWGQSESPSDLEGDGTVATGDLLMLLADWGPCA
jgi:hypothetical protein